MKKMVSVIVPVYNAAAYVRRCMESLLGQTYENTEILLIDDGSTDDTGAVCDGYGEKYENVRVFHMSCDGVSAARNRGMDEAQGEYITFVDADDCPAKDMVEHLVKLLEQTGSDVAGCGYQEFYTDEEAEKIRNGNLEENRAADSTADKKVLADSGRTGKQPEILAGTEFIEKGILRSDTRCWSKLYRRESIGSLRFDTQLTIGEDMLFLLKLARTGKTFSRSSYKGYGYFINKKGAMMRAFKDSYMDQITCWQKARKIIAEELPQQTDRAETILLISVMLVVGKLSMLSGAERRKKKNLVCQCSDVIRQYISNKSAFIMLDRGYRIKVRMYHYMPNLYMILYHMGKSLRR